MVTQFVQASHSEGLEQSKMRGALPSRAFFKIEEASEISVTVRRDSGAVLNHFDVDYLGHNGAVLTKQCFCFAKSDPVPINEVIRFGYKQDELYVELSSVRELGLNGRSDVQAGLSRDVVISLRREASPINEARPLGAPFSPSIGTSPQEIQLWAIESEVMPDWIRASEFIDRYLKDPDFVPGLSALLAVVRLSQQGWETPTSRNLSVSPDGFPFPLLGGSPLERRVGVDAISSIAGIRMSPSANPPTNPFLKVFDVSDRLQTVPMVARPNLDAVDSSAYFIYDGKPWMILIRSVRPARFAHDAPGVFTADKFTIGGVAESLESCDVSREKIIERAIAGVHEEVGVMESGPAMYLGSAYSDPGSSLERIHNVLVRIDPTTPSGALCGLDERVDIFAAPASEVVSLAERGLIHDPRLELNARLLCSKFVSIGEF